MDSNIDIIELMRECAAQGHGMARLRESLGIGIESGWQQRCLGKVADEIEAVYMRLPVDADDVPIRPGDELEPSGLLADVFELPERIKKTRAWAVNEQGAMLTHPDASGVYGGGFLRHVKPETVEDILGEAIQFGHQANTGTRIEGAIADYAERIRKAVDGTEERDALRAEVKKLGEQLDRLRGRYDARCMD